MPRLAGRHTLARSRANFAGVVLIAVALLVAGIGGYFTLERQAQHRALDPETLCPLTPRADDLVTVLLVDMSDTMTPAQQRDFQNKLENLRSNIPLHGRLEIFAVAPTADQLLAPIVSLCNPGRGAGVDPLVGNPRQTEARWRQGFAEPLARAFAAIIGASEAKRSPILESIQSVALTSFQAEGRAEQHHRLVVVSDLLQFTDTANFYAGLPEPQALLDSPGFHAVRTDLRGVKVELWMLQRPEQRNRQGRRLVLLWEEILSAQGARVTKVYNVSG